MTTDEPHVHAHWQERAQDKRLDDVDVTHPDVWQRWLELELLKPLLSKSERVLDVGCGAGYSTRIMAGHVKSIVGMDYSSEMIQRAQAAQTDYISNISFATCDALTLSPATFGMFDMAVSIRCLINILDWDRQKQALAAITSVLKTGGRLVLIEGLADGRDALNRLRESQGLEAMPKVWHNVDFSATGLLDYLQGDFVIREKRGFGVYDMISRVVHPLTVAPDAPQYTAQINKVAAHLARDRNEFEDCSRVLFWVLEKR
jgi:ubiquinone/menaquinone biosynthesis C-methylase UbiE